MKIIKCLVFVLFCFASIAVHERVSAAEQGIVAVVNEDVISNKDLTDRVRLVMASSGLPNRPDIRQRVSAQVLNALIDEQIMLQEAESMNIEITQEEVDGGFATLAQQNNMGADQFKTMIRRGGLEVSTLYRQIRAQLSWAKVVQRRLRSRVVITERDIDSKLERMRSNIGKSEYLAAEIFLPVSDKSGEAKSRELAQRIVSEIRERNASFFKLAQQFSASAGSAQGGDLGWLQEGQMDPHIQQALNKINKNQVTDPVRTQSGYHILLLRDERTLKEENLPSRDQISYQLGIERLERLQVSHLRDIRAASFIDVRTDS